MLYFWTKTIEALKEQEKHVKKKRTKNGISFIFSIAL